VPTSDFDIVKEFRRFSSGSLALTSLDHICRDHSPAFPTLTITSFGRNSCGGLQSAT
jgi:hypothetical protein